MWEKIVLNLLSNALKFTFEGEIGIALHRHGERAALTVRDTGIGIPAGQLPRLFDRFHRVPGARARTHEGTGIGLALVQELVRLHGGTVTVESAVDQGTAFTVTLPFGASHLPREHVAAPSVPGSAAGAAPFVREALRWSPPAAGRAPEERGEAAHSARRRQRRHARLRHSAPARIAGPWRWSPMAMRRWRGHGPRLRI